MSAMKPLRQTAPSEDVIDTKSEPDDPIDEDVSFVQENPLSQEKTLQRQFHIILLTLLLKIVNHLQVKMQTVVLI